MKITQKDREIHINNMESTVTKSGNKYDYLIVGAGLFGAVFAREMTDAGNSR